VDSSVACPYGCGAHIAANGLDDHQAQCLHDPRKLMAAVSQLARENQRLTLENQRLREEAAGEARARARKPARRQPGPGMCAE
jgi:regulator of replication initiation timing